MRIFNADKTRELSMEEISSIDGYLKNDTIKTYIPASPEVVEVGHYKVLQTYENGGQDVEWVVDVEGKPAVKEQTKEEQIKIFIPYTSQEITKIDTQSEIDSLKAMLEATDYQAIKYAEGVMSEEEYAPIKQERISARARINKLEDFLKTL